MLHPLEVLGVGDLPAVHPGAVALPAVLDLLDLAVGPALLDGEVVHDDARVAHLVGQLGALGLQRADLGHLGEVAALVPQLGGTGVELGDVEERVLVGGIGLQRLSCCFSGGTSTGRCTAC